MNKILVIGAAGLLGYKVYHYGRENNDMYLADKNFGNFLPKERFYKLDITDEDAVNNVILNIKPEWVILTAALTNVDLCEEDVDLAYSVNATGPKNVALASEKIGAKLVYISTDFVFDGKKKIYTENDSPNPISFYGLSKLEGEKSIRETGIDHITIRTSVLFGWHPDSNNFNYVVWVYNKLKNKIPINITYSQWNTPTLADNLAQAILKSVEKDLSGLYHMAGSECINRYDFAVKIAKIFELDESLIKPIAIFEQKAERPEYSCLDVSKASKDLNFHFYNINEALNFMKKQKNEKIE